MTTGEITDSAVAISQQEPTPTFIHFFGIRRSGNHALIHWLDKGLSSNADQSVMYVNNVAEDASTFPERQPDNIQRKITQTHPDFVILSYEELTVSDRHNLEHRSKFSNSRDQDLVLLRSFPNVMASQIQRRRNVISEGRLDRPILRLGLTAIRDIWIENAQSIRATSDSSLTGILFDKWFTDRNYRDEIANKVGFTNTDSGLSDVPDLEGVGGSSFDGTSYQGNAQNMRLTDRWHTISSSEESRSLYLPLLTPEVVELNQDLFGYDPTLPV